MSNRRRELRFQADQPVVVSVLAPLSGKIDGASKSGLRVIIPVPVAVGAFVQVKWDRAVVVGRVRYCREIGPNAYSIGVKITEIVGRGKLQTLQNPDAA
jgi:hypothetical protein